MSGTEPVLHGSGPPERAMRQGGLSVSVDTVVWPMTTPFVIAGCAYHELPTVVVTVRDAAGRYGRGEAAGVDYLGETVATMRDEIDRVRDPVEAGIGIEDLQSLLPPGGARNALDCALWDLMCVQRGEPIHAVLGRPAPGAIATCMTVGVETPSTMAARASAHAEFSVLKLKFDGGDDIARLRAVREARPDAEIIVDVNGAWDGKRLAAELATLIDLDVRLLEQPLPAGDDSELAAYDGPVPICADESLQSLSDLAGLDGRYDYVNIKLDKCGGLTEALNIAARAKSEGFGLMVGNMGGSSLAMAAAMPVAAECRFVDLDGPLLQAEDQPVPMIYRNGTVALPASGLWGGGTPAQ